MASQRRPVWCEGSCAFPHEDQHFVNCVAGLEQAIETGEDGKATLCGRARPPIIFAACESTGAGGRWSCGCGG